MPTHLSCRRRAEAWLDVRGCGGLPVQFRRAASIDGLLTQNPTCTGPDVRQNRIVAARTTCGINHRRQYANGAARCPGAIRRTTIPRARRRPIQTAATIPHASTAYAYRTSAAPYAPSAPTHPL